MTVITLHKETGLFTVYMYWDYTHLYTEPGEGGSEGISFPETEVTCGYEIPGVGARN